MNIIPLNAIPAQHLQIVLDDQDCDISVYTRGEQEILYLDLVVDGVVVQNGAILQNAVSAIQIPNRTFSGTLAIVDLQGDDHPKWSGLGDRWLLIYWSDGEEGAPRNLVPEFDGEIA